MKAVVFDFDGTLTYQTPSAWSEIWSDFGQSKANNYSYDKIMKLVEMGTLSYEIWCYLVCIAFRAKGIKKEKLNEVADRVNLIPNWREVFQQLKKDGCEIYIVSGGIKEVVERALGDDVSLVNGIFCNELIFDKNDNLKKIIPTKYDLAGKADFVERLKKEKNWEAKDICFVGNSFNDEWVWTTGCKTICVNPEKSASIDDKRKWNKVFHNLDDLLLIMPEIFNRKVATRELAM